ncbi:sulfurtransferase TusA family protein [Motilimonas pumila]|uniref:Sulfurtransferase TusA family protein n=1 Tax=Motilimonas pumila TaxID=2303987 RepID=A0A418YGV5_9GAMM|nr:sulfurtransferase TusA family protein [Motilimonas pumila]RJG49091.1 sulfurtransferase TusA family protein [Motilimonas pumila]
MSIITTWCRDILDILDCRDMVCPMPLITIRQWLARPSQHPVALLMLADASSNHDIPRYLSKQQVVFSERPAPSTEHHYLVHKPH